MLGEGVALNATVLVVTLAILFGCSDPERSQFIQLCIDNGDASERCTCTFNSLREEVGKIDAEFVDFVADFAKWGLREGDKGLDRFQIMEKYELKEEEFLSLAELVGGTMIRALGNCR
jgi:hypothetical protein